MFPNSQNPNPQMDHYNENDPSSYNDQASYDMDRPNKVRRLNRAAVVLFGFVAIIILLLIVDGIRKSGSNALRTDQEENLIQAGMGSDGGDGLLVDLVPEEQGIIINEPPPVEVDISTPSPAQPQVSVEPTPVRDPWEDQLLAQRRARLAAALNSPTKVDGFESVIQENTSSSTNTAATNSSANNYPSYSTGGNNPFANTNISGLLTGTGFGNETYEQANNQAGKAAFLANAENIEADYIPTTRRMPLSPYELKMGTFIPAAIRQGLNSDLPGQFTAQVTENVYDTATGRYLLVPAGAILVGRYDSAITFGQSRLLVAFNRLNFPDGSSLNLQGASASDIQGYAGLSDKVNNHFIRLISYGMLAALFSAAYEITNDDAVELSNTETVNQAIGREIAQIGTEFARRNLNIQPTIEIRPGKRVIIQLQGDLIFPGAY